MQTFVIIIHAGTMACALMVSALTCVSVITDSLETIVKRVCILIQQFHSHFFLYYFKDINNFVSPLIRRFPPPLHFQTLIRVKVRVLQKEHMNRIKTAILYKILIYISKLIYCKYIIIRSTKDYMKHEHILLDI